jgi:hypothetical protein
LATEILLQILYGVSIIAVIVLITVLWRAFEVLSDFKDFSSILVKRAREVDQMVVKTKDSIENFSEAVKGFVYSLGIIKTVKNTINNNKNKGE